MGFYSFIVNKLRNIRYSIGGSLNTKIYAYGAIYSGPYLQTINPIHDRNPLIFCMFGGPPLVHGLNIHYLDDGDRAWLIRNIYMIKKYQQVIDGKTLYNYIKANRYSIVKKCYRTYKNESSRFKLVSAGITSLTDLEYASNEPFVRRLNEAISATQITQSPSTVSFSPDELRNRIAESLNSIPIQQKVVSQTGSFGKATWAR